ncbi:MAG TPA: protein translocase subunit SecF [Candidatus Babeliales bacterium]|jgi:preprotein translocase subunit SecF|nr:protein translocase subunit SecF [Candidatus Babeliales bacterium]
MIDFLKFRLITFGISLSMVVGFIGIATYRYITRGSSFVYSIDFTGGTQVLFEFDKAVRLPDVKSVVNQEWPGAEVRSFSDTNILVRVKEYINDIKGLSGRIKESLEKAFPDYSIKIEQSDAVSSGVGKAWRTNSLYAVILAIIAMLIYIAWRFWSVAYALGAVIALMHDAAAILLIFLIFDLEISVNVIAAILAILGYSINDTIVIFSQIRSNVKRMGLTSLHDIVNVSLNQTLSRTMLTSISTALPVIAMLLFGGEALRDISLALLIGIVFGTYSSIYIASPIMMAVSGYMRT